MRNLIKLIAVSAVAGTLIGGAYSQAAGPTGGGVKGGAGSQGGKQVGARKGIGAKFESEILAKINPPLSQDQKAQIEKLNAQTNEALAALKEKAKSGDKSAIQPEMKRIQEDRQTALRAILSPAQQQSYMELMKDAMSKLRKDGAGVKGGQQAGARKGLGGMLEMDLLAKVNPPITAAQRAQIEQLNARTNDALAALKEKMKAGGDKAALRPEMQKIQAERREGLKSILTPAQQQSFMELLREAMLKIRKDGGAKKGDGKGG